MVAGEFVAEFVIAAATAFGVVAHVHVDIV